ncbi:MAG: ABC transporter substrate-binding protein [Desulfobacterales bacterium]
MRLNTGIKVLLVEDFHATRKMEIETLRKLGFAQILETDNGIGAMELLRENRDTGLIISDWNMPDMNGYELLVWVRSQEEFREIPFVMATAQAEKRKTEKTMGAGANGFITKPFSAQELQQVLEEVLVVKKTETHEKKSAEKSRQKIRLRVGHIQITDHLVLGVLKHMIEKGECSPRYFDLETVCMSGWNPVMKSLEDGESDAAFVLAPIAMDLFHYGVPIRLTLFAHKNGSICVKSRRTESRSSLRRYFKNKIFYIPHMLSIHHMLSSMFFQEIGLRAGLVGSKDLDVIFEVLPPVQMPEFLESSEESCGFMVAQPVGAKTIADGGAQLLFLSGELWEYHPCCVVAVQEKMIEKHPDAVQEFTELLVRAGMFIEQNPERAARIAVDFLDPEEELKLNVPMLTQVLSEPCGIRTDDLYPVTEDLEKMQRYMKEKMGIGNLVDLEKFVDTRFADLACPKTERHLSVLHDPSALVQKIMKRTMTEHSSGI